ncbi:MAG: hypothetical protein GY899_16715 [Verrucomicrobiaceae bacterium]|nr:hypothetical protein [Verrucomicrobiaceae bacterium]
MSTVCAKPWPDTFNAPAAKWTKKDVETGQIYLTQSYLILCDEALGKHRLDEMTRMVESVRKALDLFPLNLLPDHRQAGKNGKSSRHVVRIVTSQRKYLAMGGPKGSIGFYDGRSGEVTVSLELLIEPKSQHSRLEPRQRYRLLVHELVHQAMGERLTALPPWFSEGLAEYMAATQFAPGRYQFKNASRQIIDHLQTSWLGERNNVITIPHIETLSRINHPTWNTDNRINAKNAYAKYAGALLLTHYQMELASRNLGGLRKFLAKEIEYRPIRGRPGGFRQVLPSQDILWRERNPATVQQQMVTYWKNKGLNLKFATMADLQKVPR